MVILESRSADIMTVLHAFEVNGIDQGIGLLEGIIGVGGPLWEVFSTLKVKFNDVNAEIGS